MHQEQGEWVSALRDGVVLCDASVFPTASGSNPMMTVLATATMICDGLAARLQHQDGKLAGAYAGRAAERAAARAGHRTANPPVLRGRSAGQLATELAVAAAAAGGLWAYLAATSGSDPTS